MRQELLDILAVMDLKELNIQMALQCAPLFMGIKISNMLVVDSKDKERVIDTFRETAITLYALHMSSQKAIFLVYDRRKLENYLLKKENRKLLSNLGYQENDLTSILTEFAQRYQDYRKNLNAFPHELGLLLGYPIEDVMGFMVNQGQNSLYTGYWKVYGNLSEKILLFEQYQNAKEIFIRLVSQGMSIKYILRDNKRYHLKKEASAWNQKADDLYQ